ncbi:hypothetical protein, partial [Streptomyces albidoflavus]|uniref:hypothetical protein n=1 Tax=Streptomyces albidoflavus TaxID=1886 RepID=UPI00331929C9
MSLDDADLRTLLAWHHCLRNRKCIHDVRRTGRHSPTPRELSATRVWFTKVQQPQLLSVGACGLAWAHQILHPEDDSAELIEEPTYQYLLEMLGALDPPVALCALYGMLSPPVKDQPVGRLAHEYERQLRTAAERTAQAGQYTGSLRSCATGTA